MKILSLELCGFTRLSLNQIENFYMDLNSPIQLILGTNGSGKSSILQELTPYPASQYDYKKGGYKIITLMQRNEIFVLKSDFKQGQKHSFFNQSQGVELNPGGTVSVQKDLVKEYFNITLDTRELLIGTRGFTKMSVSDRRYWFTKLNDTSYDYAINVYNKLKEKARDATGALKNAKKRLVSENAALMDRVEQQKLNDEYHELHTALENLLKNRTTPKQDDHYALKQSRIQLVQAIEQTSQYVKKALKQLVFEHRGKTVNDLTMELGKYDSDIEYEKGIIKKCIEEYALLEEKVNTIKQTSQTNLAALQKNRLEVNSDMESLISTLKIVKEYSNYTQDHFRIAQGLSTTIENIFMYLPANEDMRFSRHNLSVYTEKLEKQQTQLEHLNQQLHKINAYITSQEEKKNHDEVNCPNCQHRWVLGFNKVGYDKAIAARVVNSQEQETLKKEMTETSKEIEEIKAYSLLYKDYHNLVSNYTVFKEFWDYVEVNNVPMKQPKNVVNHYTAFLEDLQVSIRIVSQQAKLKELDSLIELSQCVQNEDTASVLKNAQQLQTQIEHHTHQHNTLIQKRNVISKHLDNLNKLLEFNDKIKTFMDQMEQNLSHTTELYGSQAYDQIIKHVQVSLAIKQKALADLRVKQALIDDLENQILILSKEESSYKLLVSELSPVDGLIAQGMTGFIKIFVKQMNQIIAKIWNYPLVIDSCALQEGENVDLDYRFPFTVQNDKREDVSMGSSAMCEIFDFAFKVVASRYISSEPIGLYLDELGRAMDVEHKMKVIEYVKGLNERHAFTQTFLISHDILQYGALSNTEICVLCDANIVLPKDCVFNKHVIMS